CCHASSSSRTRNVGGWTPPERPLYYPRVYNEPRPPVASTTATLRVSVPRARVTAGLLLGLLLAGGAGAQPPAPAPAKSRSAPAPREDRPRAGGAPAAPHRDGPRRGARGRAPRRHGRASRRVGRSRGARLERRHGSPTLRGPRGPRPGGTAARGPRAPRGRSRDGSGLGRSHRRGGAAPLAPP